MKAVEISELKANLASYLRIVKSGEQVEIHERGVAVAVLSATGGHILKLSTPPRKEPKALAQMKFSVRPARDLDALGLLLEDRRKR